LLSPFLCSASLDLADLTLNLAAAEIVFRRSNPNFTPLIADFVDSSSPVRSSEFTSYYFPFCYISIDWLHDSDGFKHYFQFMIGRMIF
jgi:hypothetical protein